MRGALVVHGLTGTPATVACLTEALTASGFRVIAPTLSGHGKSFEELADSTWHEWMESVRMAYAELSQKAETIFYAGISLGALLGLKLAAEEGVRIRALALMSTPITLSLMDRLGISLIRHTPLKWIIRSIPKRAQQSVKDPLGQKFYIQHSLPRIPVTSASQVLDLQKILRKELQNVVSPVLLIHATKDFVAPYSNVALLKKLLGSNIVETAPFSRSRHVITLDLEKDLAANAVVQFFNRFA